MTSALLETDRRELEVTRSGTFRYEILRRPEMMTAPTAQFQATSTATSPSLLKTRRAWQGLRPVKVWQTGLAAAIGKDRGIGGDQFNPVSLITHGLKQSNAGYGTPQSTFVTMDEWTEVTLGIVSRERLVYRSSYLLDLHRLR
jgi:hypothetical protein